MTFLRRPRNLFLGIAVALVLSPIGLDRPLAQTVMSVLAPVDTSSPRATLDTFLRLNTEAESAFSRFQASPSPSSQRAVVDVASKAARLLDLSQLPPSQQTKSGRRALIHLADVIRRIDLPPLGEVPAVTDGTLPQRWRIPGTDISIARVDKGERQGEYLFSPDTVSRAEEFDLATRQLPGADRIPSWHDSGLGAYGWMMPSSVIAALPGWARTEFAGDPIWKLLTAAAAVVILALFVLAMRWLASPAPGASAVKRHFRLMLTPLSIIFAVWLLDTFIATQLGLFGFFDEALGSITTAIFNLAAAWLFWHVAFLVIEAIISSPTIPDQSLDANLLRLVARVAGVIVVVLFLAKLAQDFGVPVLGIAAGLGAGGLAFGLAAQGSLENLIAALNLYFDKPVRVGDLCEYGGKKGFVEHIGLRSTAIRGLDRSLISVPNAEIARAEIINLSRRDNFLFRHTLDLVYETTMDQLRTLSVTIGEHLGRNERVVRSPIEPRVRVVEFAEWSIRVEVFSYLRAADYAEFLALQQKLLFEIADMVSNAGTSFAFPSRTVYAADQRADAGQSGSSPA